VAAEQQGDCGDAEDWRCGKPVGWLWQNSFAGLHDDRERIKQATIVSWGPPW
jgi:hypothetical protein